MTSLYDSGYYMVKPVCYSHGLFTTFDEGWCLGWQGNYI